MISNSTEGGLVSPKCVSGASGGESQSQASFGRYLRTWPSRCPRQLPGYVVGDNEIVPVAVGKRLDVGIGLVVSDGPETAARNANPGVDQQAPDAHGDTRAHTTVVGRLEIARSPDGSPVVNAVRVGDVVAVLMGLDRLREELDGSWVRVSGDLVIEPYLWAETGLIRQAIPEGIASWRVHRIRYREFDSPGSGRGLRGSTSSLRDASQVRGAGSTDPAVNYLIDLEYVGVARSSIED